MLIMMLMIRPRLDSVPDGGVRGGDDERRVDDDADADDAARLIRGL